MLNNTSQTNLQISVILEGERGPKQISSLTANFVCYYDRCNYCGNCSERPSRFYELDLNIKGHKQLEDSLSEFLKVSVIPLCWQEFSGE